jgi:small-conductance mechanosensitive channel
VNQSEDFVFLTNDWLGLLLQICRVEDIIIEGIITGSVVHFHWVRTVVVQSSGLISASGLGMIFASFIKNFDTMSDQQVYVDLSERKK